MEGKPGVHMVWGAWAESTASQWWGPWDAQRVQKSLRGDACWCQLPVINTDWASGEGRCCFYFLFFVFLNYEGQCEAGVCSGMYAPGGRPRSGSSVRVLPHLFSSTSHAVCVHDSALIPNSKLCTALTWFFAFPFKSSGFLSEKWSRFDILTSHCPGGVFRFRWWAFGRPRSQRRKEDIGAGLWHPRAVTPGVSGGTGR